MHNAGVFGLHEQDAVKLAERANRHYVQFFVPVFTVALGIAVVQAEGAALDPSALDALAEVIGAALRLRPPCSVRVW